MGWLAELRLKGGGVNPQTSSDIVAWAGVAVALIGVAAAFAALIPAWRAARAAAHQTELQREIAEAAAQPYVWLEVRLERYQDYMLDVVVGNAGPTMATDIRFEIEPPLPWNLDLKVLGMDGSSLVEMPQRLSCLGPGHQRSWVLGSTLKVGKYLEEHGLQLFRVRVTANGPHGPVRPLEYAIDLLDLSRKSTFPEGTLFAVAKELKAVVKEVKVLTKEVKTAGSRLGEVVPGPPEP
jgi:hypothetical protein